ncbi:hypothetical protein C8Q80DRAFT_1115948 [Daedaleopsis nitida]|nr:hypothetical protein C8Q80DRAFT_1115948 [Daedaleopsis nitida]
MRFKLVSHWQLKLAPLCLFVAFLLLLLVSLSLPRIKGIYLFELTVNASIGILKTGLGYDLDSTLADILHIGSVAELISKALSDAMILHIITICIVDYKFISSVGDNVNHKFFHILTLSRGNAAWMVLVAMCLLWVSTAAIATGIPHPSTSQASSTLHLNDFPLRDNYPYSR